MFLLSSVKKNCAYEIVRHKNVKENRVKPGTDTVYSDCAPRESEICFDLSVGFPKILTYGLFYRKWPHLEIAMHCGVQGAYLEIILDCVQDILIDILANFSHIFYRRVQFLTVTLLYIQFSTVRSVYTKGCVNLTHQIHINPNRSQISKLISSANWVNKQIQKWF